MIFDCFLARYPQGKAVTMAVNIAPIKLNIVNIMAKDILDFAENAFITRNTALAAKYPWTSV